MSKNEKIYYENFKDAIDRNRKKIPAVHKKKAGRSGRQICFI